MSTSEAVAPVAPVPDGARPAIRLRDVTAGYGIRVALDKVDLEIATGSLLAIIGPNGAGKSTLLKVIAGLLPPFSGTVEVLAARRARRRSASRTCRRPRWSIGAFR